MKPRLLDLFCGAGGCSVGYHRAGFEVVGVDIADQPRYPFGFTQMDALDVLDNFLYFEQAWGRFDAIHASPPCQAYSKALKHLAKPKAMLIDAVRGALEATDLPWVIENVIGAPMPVQSDLEGRHGVMVCGTALGLRVERHRLFETNFPLYAPSCSHTGLAMNPHNQAGRDRIYAEFGRQDPEVIWRKEMGVEWMRKSEGREAIPPAYTELIGHQLMAYLNAKEMAA